MKEFETKEPIKSILESELKNSENDSLIINDSDKCCNSPQQETRKGRILGFEPTKVEITKTIDFDSIPDINCVDFSDPAPKQLTPEEKKKEEERIAKFYRKRSGSTEGHWEILTSRTDYDDTSGYFQNRVDEFHYWELHLSGIHDDIINLNFESIKGGDVYDSLVQSKHFDEKRNNRGGLCESHQKYFNSLWDGGWRCAGLDPLKNWETMRWLCFKPDNPRFDNSRNRPIKYEYPPKVRTRVFFFRISQPIADKIADKYGIERFPANQFWQRVIENKLPVTITEGAKKAAALLSAGFIAVGIPSHNGGYRKYSTILEKDEQPLYGDRLTTAAEHLLIPELYIFRDRPINLALDKDDKRATRQQVNKSNNIYIKLFKLNGCEVNVLEWEPKEGKGIDDVLVNHGEARLNQIFGTAKSSNTWQTATLFQLTYAASIEVCSRYLSNAINIKDIPADARLLDIKSVKGTGKTELLHLLVAEGLKHGNWVILITHRTQLGKELARRIGVNYVTEIRDDETGDLFGFALCFESLHPKSQAQFNADHWTNKGTVILDECEQSIWSLLSSSTCEKNRLPILKQFAKLIRNTLRKDGEGRVILSDADASDITVDLIKEVANRKDITPFVILNNWKPGDNEKWTVYRYKGNNPGQLYNDLIEKIANGEKPFVTTSGQRAMSKWSTKNIEKDLKSKFPDASILRIDSETIVDKNHPAFGCIDKLNEVLINYHIVIASPTIETGVSIDIKHFTSVWSIFQGLQSTSSALQTPARIRDNIPRYIWARNVALPGAFMGNGSSNSKELWATENEKMMTLTGLLKNAGCDWNEETNEEIPNNAFYNCYLKMAARHNSGCWNYANSIFDYLKEEGHNIIPMEEDSPIANEVSKTMGEQRDESYKAEREVISNIDTFKTEVEYQKSKDSREKNSEDHLKERRWEIQKRYGQDCTPELIERDDDGWHYQLLLHYYLTLGKEYLPKHDQQKIKDLLVEGEGTLWKPSVLKRCLSLTVTTLKALKIDKLAELVGQEVSNENDLLKEIDGMLQGEKRHFMRCQVKSFLGVTIPQIVKKKEEERPTTPVEKLSAILPKIGLKLAYRRSEGKGKNRVRFYVLLPCYTSLAEDKSIPTTIDDGRESIFAHWLNQDLIKALTVSSSDTKGTTHLKTEVSPPNNDFVSKSDTTEPRNFVSNSDTKGTTKPKNILFKGLRGSKTKLKKSKPDFLQSKDGGIPQEVKVEEPKVRVRQMSLWDELVKPSGEPEGWLNMINWGNIPEIEF